MSKKTKFKHKKVLLSGKITDRSGRPTLYTKELAEKICNEIAVNVASLEDICEKNPEFPHHKTIRFWRYKNAEFLSMYASAKKHQAEVAIEEIRQQALKYDKYIDDKGRERIDQASIARQRLIVDTEKWIASKIIPRVYGNTEDLVTATHQNAILRDELLKLREELRVKNEREY